MQQGRVEHGTRLSSALADGVVTPERCGALRHAPQDHEQHAERPDQRRSPRRGGLPPRGRDTDDERAQQRRTISEPEIVRVGRSRRAHHEAREIAPPWPPLEQAQRSGGCQRDERGQHRVLTRLRRVLDEERTQRERRDHHERAPRREPELDAQLVGRDQQNAAEKQRHRTNTWLARAELVHGELDQHVHQRWVFARGPLQDDGQGLSASRCVLTSSSQSEHSRATWSRKAKLARTMQASAKPARRALLSRATPAPSAAQRLFANPCTIRLPLRPEATLMLVSRCYKYQKAPKWARASMDVFPHPSKLATIQLISASRTPS